MARPVQFDAHVNARLRNAYHGADQCAHVFAFFDADQCEHVLAFYDHELELSNRELAARDRW